MTTSTETGVARRWRAARTPMVIGVLMLLTAVLVAVIANRAERGLLEPDAVDRAGSRALVEVLRGEGVQVELASTLGRAGAAGADATLLVTFPDRLSGAALEQVRDVPADLVLVAPGPAALEVLAPRLDVLAPADVDERAPDCDLAAARAAGSADSGGVAYSLDGPGTGCYPADDGPTLVALDDGDRRVTVLGTPLPLTNGALTRHGNAALAVALLGARPRLVWYLPQVGAAPPAGGPTPLELLPAGWLWGAAQLGVAALLVALWRARRLGPVVTEPLPVVVRSAEAVEGQARLYRTAGVRGHAAEQLRGAATARLCPLLGLPAAADPAAVVASVVGRTDRPGSAVEDLLYGPAPTDDAALVRLAAGLDAVEREVRRS